ncbi:MAG: L-threonylcarbamoyladenylate synthase [Zestosphaera sp.]
MLKVDPINPDKEVISEAVEVLREGGLVAFPTETVYGLGADSFNKSAVKKIYSVKGRPPDNPLILHISDFKELEVVAKDVPSFVYELANKVWPGPVTFVLKKSDLVLHEVTAGLPTVAVRCPAHPVALALIKGLGNPIAAPSANLSGRPSPTTADHVIKDLSGKIEMILEGGDTFFGVESTIINLTTDPPVLLRPGPVGVEELEKLTNLKILIPAFAKGTEEAGIALSPGTKYRHYSPQTMLVLVEAGQCLTLAAYLKYVKSLINEYLQKRLKVAIICSKETCSDYGDLITLEIGSRNNLYEVAKNLFKKLRELDELRVDVAISESFKEQGIGLAIMNRLRKASSKVVACVPTR